MIILVLIACYGFIIGVLSSRGAILAGVIGAIAVVLALHMGSILAVDPFGSLLFALAHGMLTGGGIAASLIGGLVFFDPSDPVFRLLRGCIIEGVIVWAASFAFGVPRTSRPAFAGQGEHRNDAG